jgi:hypothetical protein
MAAKALIWKLVSPYDAYVSHVAVLNHAIEQISYFGGLARGYEAGIEGSMRVGVTSEVDAAARVQRFREQLGQAAGSMSDEQFEDFIAHLGGGSTANVETDRDRAHERLGHMTRGLEEYFAIAGRELAILEERGYDPSRRDIARQLRENRLPTTTLGEYRHLLHELGAKAAVVAAT